MAGSEQERRLRLYLVRHGESEANQNGVFAGQLDSPLTERGISDAKSLGEGSEYLISRQAESEPQSQVAEDEPRESQPCHFFDKVFSSDLTRALRTCSLILEGMETRQRRDNSNNNDSLSTEGTTKTKIASSASSCDIQTDQLLRERSYGTLQGMPWSMDRKESDKIWRDTHGIDEPTPLWESDDDIWIRAKAFLSKLIQDELFLSAPAASDTTETAEEAKHATKHVLITSHGGVLRQILMRLVGVDKLLAMGAVFDPKRKNRIITPNTSLTILDLSVWCKDQQQPADLAGQNEEEDGVDIQKSNEYLEGVEVDLFLFANTDHLKRGVRIHDD